MDEEQKTPVFALDIGTRSIVGIVGRPEEGRLKVLAVETAEHDGRTMMDGQIDDIRQVARLARTVTERLETRPGLCGGRPRPPHPAGQLHPGTERGPDRGPRPHQPPGDRGRVPGRGGAAGRHPGLEAAVSGGLHRVSVPTGQLSSDGAGGPPRPEGRGGRGGYLPARGGH